MMRVVYISGGPDHFSDPIFLIFGSFDFFIKIKYLQISYTIYTTYS